MEENASAKARRRLAGFRNHLIGYFLMMTLIVPINYITSPENPWFLLPMIGWGAVLGIHAAFAMGLFGVFRGKKD